MDSSLRERFARLGPIRAIDRVTSGSPAVFVLCPVLDGVHPRTIDAAHALVRRGLPMLRAKRAVETLLAKGRVFVELPMVEDPHVLAVELAKAGIRAVWLHPEPDVDVRALRERLGMTREQFALHYGLEVETLRNWETGKREPDRTARSYLRAIANAPESVELAYAPIPEA